MIDLFRWLLLWWSPRIKILRLLADSGGEMRGDAIRVAVNADGWIGARSGSFAETMALLAADRLVASRPTEDTPGTRIYALTEAGRAMAVLL